MSVPSGTPREAADYRSPPPPARPVAALSSNEVRPPTTPLGGAGGEELRRWVDGRTSLIEKTLEGVIDNLARPLPSVREAIELAVGTRGRGGRRWRPLLTIAAAEACGGACDALPGVAAAVELTHTASLILDDLPSMDDAAERRNLPATHVLLGEGRAILVAMGLLGRAAELLARSPRGGPGLIADWGTAFGLPGMAGGQVVDLGSNGTPFMGADRRLHREKTTALSRFALGAGARAAGASPAAIMALEGYGRDLGWAYQLLDDVRDAGEDARLGRPAGGHQPIRQARRLVARATRGLEQCPELDPGGRARLVALARMIVPVSSPGGGSGG
jgi:geranylgeranyl pyrophosphate synthase